MARDERRFYPAFPHILDFEMHSGDSFAHCAQMVGRGLRPSLWSIDEVIGWPTPARLPPMVRALEPAPEPESASVTLLRSLVADRRRIKQNAESSRKSRLTQADEADRRAADLRERAKGDEATAAQADEEIAAILADIEKLGGKPETDA